MKIYETAVRKPISTILIFVGVIVFGLFSLNNLAVDQYPDIEIPQIAVITSYAGVTVCTCQAGLQQFIIALSQLQLFHNNGAEFFQFSI